MKRISMTDENWATAIKIAAVLVAVPRWIGALLEADGAPLLLTESTRYYWGAFSALASAGMALVEGVAFWYTLRAWRQHGGKLLGALIALSMAAFAVVLTPYIMANVTGAKLAQVLAGNWLVAWSSCVSLSTILIVASVGYAQPRKQEQAAQQVGASEAQPVTPGLDKPAQPDSNLSTSSASVAQAWKPANLTPDSHSQADDSGHDAPKSRQNATPSDSGEKHDKSTAEDGSTSENADSQLDKPWTDDTLSGAERVRLYSAMYPHTSKAQVANLLGVNLSTVSRNWRGNGTHKTAGKW